MRCLKYKYNMSQSPPIYHNLFNISLMLLKSLGRYHFIPLTPRQISIFLYVTKKQYF